MFASGKTSAASTGGYQISRSLRFNSADSAYLNRTPASASNRKTWTWSAWVKRSALLTTNVPQNLFGARNGGGSPSTLLRFDDGTSATANGLLFQDDNGAILRTTPQYRDVSAWYHIVLAVDTTQSTASNRVRLYINNVEVTAFSTATYPTQNLDMAVNSTNDHRIGNQPVYGDQFNGYMTETYLIDGSQLTPSSFGETNAQTGVWQPKAYSGSYGTNGFYLNFSDNSNTTAATLGKDYSGNGNNWTPNNFSVTAGAGNDSLVDSPTSYGTDTGVGGTVRGNYATVNPLQLISNVVVSNGNLFLQSNNNQDQWASAPSTIAVRTGKWYAEFTPTNVAGSPDYMFGVVRATWSPIILDGGGYYGRFWYTTEGYSYYSNGSFYTGNSIVSSGASYVTSNVVGVALDLDAGSITFYKNGVSQGTPFTSIPLGVDYVFAGGAFTTPYPTPTNIGSYFANFGQRPFAYTAPSGFKALCTQNLPTPTIGATTATQAGKYFNTVLYTGTGATLSVTGANFQPDLVWIKQRNASRNHNLYDAVRGTLKVLQANVSDAEVNYASSLTSFDSDGFSLGTASDVNVNAATYVAWNWKANGSTVTNTAGSITSTVSANTTSGFSIVTFTTDGTTKTVGHGLGVAPKMIIVKQRNGVGGAWYVFTTVIDGTYDYLSLNTTDAAANSSYTAPTATVFEYNDDNAATQVAYCFAEVAGYSKFGSYTGNGSTDGPFVYCGFRPAYVMFKNASVSGSWEVYDTTRNTYNTVDNYLLPNVSDAEGVATNRFDYLSNGVKVRNTGGSINGSGNTIIFMAFASNPFKYSLAR